MSKSLKILALPRRAGGCGFDSLKIRENTGISRMPGKGRPQSLWWSHFEMVGGIKLYIFWTRSSEMNKHSFSLSLFFFFPFSLTMNWWRADDKLMTRWWRADDKLMTSWWRADDELMASWWRADDELMTSWWRADDELMTNWWRTDAKPHYRTLKPISGTDGRDGMGWMGWLSLERAIYRAPTVLINKS